MSILGLGSKDVPLTPSASSWGCVLAPSRVPQTEEPSSLGFASFTQVSCAYCVLLGRDHYLEGCLSQTGGLAFKQEKVYDSPDRLQGFLSGSAQEEQRETKP